MKSLRGGSRSSCPSRSPSGGAPRAEEGLPSSSSPPSRSPSGGAPRAEESLPSSSSPPGSSSTGIRGRSADQLTAFEPTELPSWRTTDSVYGQLFVVNKGIKTSEMLRRLESRTEGTLNESNLSDEEWAEFNRLKKHVDKLAKQLKKRPLKIDDIRNIRSALTRSGTAFRSTSAISTPLNPGHDPVAYLAPEFISLELDELVKFYNGKRQDCTTLLQHFKLVAYFGAGFTCIHPFEDGNGRVMRVLLPAMILCFLRRQDPLFICGTEIKSTRRLVLLYALEQTNKAWSVKSPVKTLSDMLHPKQFCAFLIEAAWRMWDVVCLPDKLPAGMVPKQYNFFLKGVDLKTLRGRLRVRVSVSNPTKLVQMNSVASLVIESVAAFSSGSQSLQVSSFWIEESAKRLMIALSEPPDAGSEFVLTIEYIVKHNAWTSFFQHEGETRFVLVLNPIPGAASCVFPCWDDPSIKASYCLKVARGPATVSVLSNMQLARGDSSTQHFCVSMPLASEQMCVVLGHFGQVGATSQPGVMVRLYVQENRINSVKQDDVADALDVVMKLLGFYERYFDQAYPLEKLDVVALPGFPESCTGAKLGCIVFPEAELFHDKFKIAHAVASLWTRSIVSTNWWSYYWLDLGLIHLVAEAALRELYPQASHFQVPHLQHEMTVAIRASSPPLQIEVLSIAEHLSRDRSLETTAKRSHALLSMLECWIGAQEFQELLRGLMAQRRNGTYTPDELWNLRPTIASPGVTAILKSSWLFTSSFPVLMVSLTTDGSLRYDQRSFYGDEDGVWTIAFRFVGGVSAAGDVQSEHIMESQSLVVSSPGELEWMRVSVGDYNCCVVEYDEATLKLVCQGVRSRKLSVEDRLGAIWNAVTLSSISKHQLAALLDAVDAEEEEQQVLEAVDLARAAAQDHS